MTMTIGRCALITDPYDMDLSGNEWTFNIDIVPSVVDDVNEMKARRQQLAGLADNKDEPVIPVTWSEDPTFNGYYRVLSVNVPSTPVMLSTGFVIACQVSLERLAGYSNTQLESTITSVIRTNGHAITTAGSVPYLVASTATGAEVDNRSGDTYITTAADYARSCEDSSSLRVWTATAPLATTTVRQSVRAGEAYYGTARLEIQYGSTWYPVTGQSLPILSSTPAWRLSNGYVRLTSASAGVPATLGIWNGSAWETANVAHRDNSGGMYAIGIAEPLYTGLFTPITILRNSPEQVSIKFSDYNADVVYSIQRGTSHVTAVLSLGAASNLGIGYATANACTAITGGIHRTSNDANGNRLVFSIAAASTNDLTNGTVRPSSNSKTISMMMGVEFNGSSSSTPNTAAQIVGQFMGQFQVRQRAVRR